MSVSLQVRRGLFVVALVVCNCTGVAKTMTTTIIHFSPENTTNTREAPTPDSKVSTETKKPKAEDTITLSTLHQLPPPFDGTGLSGCVDPYFNNFHWFRALRAQASSLDVLPSGIACGLRPLGLDGARASPRPRPVVVGLLSHPDDDREIIDEIKNIMGHTTFSTGVVVHVDAHSGKLSLPLVKELRSIMHQTQRPVSGNNNTEMNEARFAMNPFRVTVNRFRGSILLGHLANYAVAKALGWEPQYYLMIPSNSRFVRCGVEEHISRVQLSFGKFEVCHHTRAPKNTKRAKAYTRAMILGPLSQRASDCWVLCADGGKTETVVALLATLLNVKPWQNATNSSELNVTAALTWVRSVIMPKYTIVQQRHEGAYYPGIALDSLMNFLAQSKGGFSDDISNQVRFPSHKFQGGAGLRILEEAWVAAEEFVLTTWIVNKLPELIPGTVSDRVSRDITTYLVSGRQVEASLDDVKKTSSLGFFTAKRLVFSSKATRSIQEKTKFKGGCPARPLEQLIDNTWKQYASEEAISSVDASLARESRVGGNRTILDDHPFPSVTWWGPCCPPSSSLNQSQSLQQTAENPRCRRCIREKNLSAPVRHDVPPETRICGRPLVLL